MGLCVCVCVYVSSTYCVEYGERVCGLPNNFFTVFLGAFVFSFQAEIPVYGNLFQCLVHLCVQRERERERFDCHCWTASYSSLTLITDPEEVFRMLRQMTHGTAAELHFLSILQHMLLIRDDYWAR